MRDVLDIDLHDHQLGDEILLLTSLMVVASEATQPLSQAIIDACLGGSVTQVQPAQPSIHRIQAV